MREPIEMRERVKALDGVVNFRDFGGYEGVDGAMVRPGRLFRSAHFSAATDADMAALDALGVATVVDLRRPEERAQEPNRWPGAGVRVVTNDEGLMAPPPHEGVASGRDWSEEGVDHYMRLAYAAYPYEPRYVALFSEFLRAAARHDAPAVIHCAAGKDRTGSLAALTLRLLGVAEEAVAGDYLLTNTAVDIEARIPRTRERIAAGYGVTLSDPVLRRMLSVQADYLSAYFGAIGARYAGLEDYAADVLDIGRADLEALRQRLLG